MRYTSFSIRNFKGIHEIDIDLSRLPNSPVFALVGLNESGKTTILEAIHWLYDDSRIDSEDLIPKSQLTNFNGCVSVESSLSLSSEEISKIENYLYKHCYKFKQVDKIRTISIRRECRFVDSQMVENVQKWDIHLEGKTSRAKNIKVYEEGENYWDRLKSYIKRNFLPPIIFYEDFLFEFPEKIYLQAKEGKQLTSLDKQYKSVVQDVITSIDRKMSVKKHLVDRLISGQKRPLEATLNTLSSTVSKKVFRIWKDLLKFDTSKMEISFGHTVEEDDNGYYLEVSVKEDDQDFLIRERSKGFQWFFAFFLFTIFRANRYEQEVKALFLVDEPASNLHPTAQSKLLDVFEKIPNQQTIIYTTHSRYMINPRWLSGTFVIRNEALDYESVDVLYSSRQTEITAAPYFRFAAENPGETDYFQPILDALDFQPSQLELTPSPVIMEGKNDYYTFRYALDCGWQGEYSIENITAGFGKDTLDCLISLHIGWNTSFIVLLDDDKGGRATHKRLKQKFGDILKGKIFRLNEIDSRFKGGPLEDVFTKPDQIKIIRSVFPDEREFNKDKFNIALQNSCFNQQEIQICKHTRQRFELVFKFLKEKLESSDVEDLV